MDDPTQRPPVPPYALPPAPGDAAPHYPPQVYGPPPVYPVQVASLPGMPPVHMVAPGVSVQISNVHVQPYPMPMPYGQPQQMPMQAQPGVVDLMRNDAQQRAMDAVARRGPARVLGFVLGSGATVMLVGLLMTLLAGANATAVAVAAVPVVLVAVVGFALAARAGRGVEGHHLEQAILELASRHEGVVRVVALAQHTGRPLRECQTAIDAMVTSGHATIEADESGALIYRIPDLEPRRRVLVAGTEVGGR